MGVQGLWRLIEPSGKPVPLETLENKILAVDVSIWLHQAIKGFQDSKGAPLPNAHLLGIYHRVCKLLYFRVKPVFVFDGGVPLLKKQTIANRQQQKNKNIKDANDIQSKLLKTLLKHTAISKVISDKSTSPPENPSENSKTKDSIYMLPELPAPELDSTLDSGSSSDESSNTSPIKQWEYHTIDVKSEHFRSLPADVRHEILTDIIETRKQSSWGRLHEIPTESNDFSSYQMNRLLKRFTVQSTLEETIKEMGGHSLSLGELEQLLKADGIATESGRRIASDENTRYLLIKDVQKAIAEAKDDEEKKKLIKETLEVIEEEPNENKSTNNEYEEDLAAAIQLSLQEEPSSPQEIVDKKIESKISESQIEIDSTNDNEYEKDLAAAIQLSLQDQPSTSKDEDFSLIDHSINEEYDSDSDTVEVTKVTRLQQAKSYMMEYSGLTPSEIDKIINANKQKSLNKKQNIINKKFSEIKPTKATSTETKNNLNNQIHSETITIVNKSDSEDSFIEVPDTSVSENKTVEIMSDSDDSDFVEVKTTKAISLENKITNPSLQIVIDPNKEVKDDIFSDIFNEKQTEINLENNSKPLETVINKKIEDNILVENQTELISEIKDTKLDETDTVISKDKEPIKQVSIQKPILTVDELSKMKNDLATEQQELIVQRNTKQRIAENITDQMYQEAQELLELFGVPYIVAPMEAEAQCAFLNEIDLTHGTITDDSDIWLFGGKTVYKNFFNHNKHVLEFRAESIEHHFKLTREQLILLALLVGSDYTVGIQGIGPVTALEILAAFPPSRTTNISVLTQAELTSGLNEFKKWLSNSKAIGVARTTLRNKLKNVNIKEGFPSLQVVHAYLQPEVETCADKFTWSKPDIVGLIDFAKEKFGWTRLKSEEILKPVIKKMEDKNLQKTIKDYFAAQYKNTADIADGKMSKRVKTAIKRLGNKNETSDDENAKQSKQKRIRKAKKVDEPSTSTTIETADDENFKQNKPKRTRKTKIIGEASTSTTNNTPDEENTKQSKPKRTRKIKKVDEASTSADTISQTICKTNGKDEETSAENSNKEPAVEETETNIKIDENKNGGSKVYSNRFCPHPTSIEAKRRVKALRKEQLHAKQTIPQKERDKKDALKNKLRAIEAFRKSKAGPGFVQKRPKVLTPLKDDAELSESSSD